MKKWLAVFAVGCLLGAACNPKTTSSPETTQTDNTPSATAEAGASQGISGDGGAATAQRGLDIVYASKMARTLRLLFRNLMEPQDAEAANNLPFDMLAKMEQDTFNPLIASLEDSEYTNEIRLKRLSAVRASLAELRKQGKVNKKYLNPIASELDKLEAKLTVTEDDDEIIALSGDGSASSPDTATAIQEESINSQSLEISLPSGLKYTVIQPGSGKPVEKGNRVAVHYTGSLIDGTMFDENTNSDPFEFTVGEGKVIKGWDEGVLGMQSGEKRRLVIPPNLGYGKSGSGPIPGNATLIFDIELVAIH